ncbi:MAG: gamma-glutamylcyclotransferase [Chloroflexi bacterium]|nr:gamma-glutamylcyclotransferase [Chloroflexota bacterium]
MNKIKPLPFFVYGTLLPNQPNFFLWESDIVRIEFASFNGGQLYDMGHYPMVVAAQGQTVQGMMMTVVDAAYNVIQQRLDELEGFNPAQPETSAYRRQSVYVTLANGRLQQAWIYMGQLQYVADKPIVPSGDWATYAAKKQIESYDWWRNVNSVAGLH